MKKCFTIFLLYIVMATQAQINNGLVGKFYFNDGTKTNEVDADHSLYDGIQGLSNPTLTTDRFGNANKAYYFNGNAAMYYYNSSSGPDKYDLNLMDAISISVWIKPDEIFPNISRAILCRWNGLATSEQFLLELSGANTLTAIRSVNSNGDVDTTTYASNTWYHIVFTYNKNDNNRHKIYVNGVLKHNKTFSGAYVNSGGLAALLVGMRTNGNNAFKGVIDDISIYDRALTDADVTCLYNEPNPASSSPVSLGVTLSASSLSICSGNSVTLSATPSGAVANYSWNAGITSNAATATVTPLSTTTYTVNVTDASGCYGASASLEVIVNDLPVPNVIHLGNILSTQPAFSSYQWMLNNNDIPGATSQTYTATQNGSYSVRVTDANGCTNTSSAVNVTISSVSEIVDFRSMVYPNPASSDLMVEASELIDDIKITDVTGRVVFNQSKIENQKYWLDISALAEATYFIQIKITNGKTAMKSFVKQ